MLASASRLNTWMNCPLQAYFKYEERLPTEQSGAASYGTIMHYVVEQMDRGYDADGAVELFKKLWAEPERLSVKPDWWPPRTSYHTYLEKGVKSVKAYKQMMAKKDVHIIAHEYPFLVDIGEHQIRGYIDRLELRDTGHGEQVLTITDFKTAAKRPTKFDLRTDLQFSIYIYASYQKAFWTGIENSPEYLGFENGEKLWKHFEDTERAGVYLMLGPETCTELDVGERGEQDFQQLYRLITEVDNAQRNKVYVPRISYDTCGRCDFFDRCQLAIPKPSLDTNIDERPRVV